MKKFKKMPNGRTMLKPAPTDWCWVDGKMYKQSDVPSRWSPPALHYGRSVFSGAQLYEMVDGGATIYALPEHLRRLVESAQSIGILATKDFPHLPQLPFSIEELCEATWKVAEANNCSLHYVRHLIWMSDGGQGVKLAKDAQVSVSVETWPFENLFDTDRALTVLINSSFSRPSDPTATVPAKSGGSGMYIVSTRAKNLATDVYGCDDTLLCYNSPENGERLIAECSTNNILLVDWHGRFVMPKPIGNFLFGTTAQTVLYLLNKNGFEVEVTDVPLEDLMLNCFGAALTMGNAAGLTSIAKFVTEQSEVVEMQTDFEEVEKLKKLYHDFVRNDEGWKSIPFHFDNGLVTDFSKLY